MNATPSITQGRWAAILARHPPGYSSGRGPGTFPAPLLMAALRELRAELVIARTPLVGDRHADDAGTTIALFSPSAYEQIKELACSRGVQDEGQGAPTIVVADASASQLQATLAAAASGMSSCK
eukprot:5445659-Pyramimonas_sp.AAC.2